MTLDDGKFYPARTYPPLYPEPRLSMDWDGHVAILWEDGPDEWAYLVTGGGSSEEERSLAADASREFGAEIRAPEHEPVSWPAGVEAEPYFSFVLCLYPT